MFTIDVALLQNWISQTHLVQQLQTMHSRVSDTGRRSSGSRGPLSLATHGTQFAQTALYDQPDAQGVRWQRQPFNSHLLTEKQQIKRLPDILYHTMPLQWISICRNLHDFRYLQCIIKCHKILCSIPFMVPGRRNTYILYNTIRIVCALLILVYQLCTIHPWVQQSEVGVEGGQ